MDKIEWYWWAAYLVPAGFGVLLLSLDVIVRFYKTKVQPKKWPKFVRAEIGDPKNWVLSWMGIALVIPGLGTMVGLLMLRGALGLGAYGAINWVRERMGLKPLDTF